MAAAPVAAVAEVVAAAPAAAEVGWLRGRLWRLRLLLLWRSLWRLRLLPRRW